MGQKRANLLILNDLLSPLFLTFLIIPQTRREMQQLFSISKEIHSSMVGRHILGRKRASFNPISVRMVEKRGEKQAF